MVIGGPLLLNKPYAQNKARKINAHIFARDNGHHSTICVGAVYYRARPGRRPLLNALGGSAPLGGSAKNSAIGTESVLARCCPLDLRCVTTLWYWAFSKHESAPDPVVYSDSDERIIAAKRNCVRIQQRYAIERGSGLSDAHIERFCDCFTPTLVRLLNEDDLKNLGSTEPVSADVQEKGRYATRWCERVAPILDLPAVAPPSGYSFK
jgi:hypothetical protein